jgi:diguanylate cyclase (GGDEF)-like protein
VLLDIDMPRVGGIELCRVMRNDPRWSATPVVFLTARTEPETVHRVFAAGADDYVSKPIVGPELVTRVTNRLERVHLHRALAQTDPLTGVANRRRSEELITQLLNLAARQRQPFSLALLDLDRFKQVNDRHGHGVGDEVLRGTARLLERCFRAEDVVARWGGEEFVVGMYGMDRDDGVNRVADALELLREETFALPDGGPLRVSFSAGVAQFPMDGADLASLYRAADTALYHAKDAGRDRVLPVGWAAADPDGAAVDVALVDGDESRACRLAAALRTRGYSVRSFADPREADAALAAPHPSTRASVALLDASAPGMDVDALTRALSDRGTRVVARANEADGARAWDAGAFDCIPVDARHAAVLQRVRRALRT